MKLSVIVVNYNGKYFPRMCCEALFKTKANFDFEIIFVDNQSSDESIDYLRQEAKKDRIRLIESGANLGYGQGNNLGVANAKGEYVIILNPDIFVREDSLQKIVDYMEANPEVGVLGPKLIYYNGKVQRSCRREMGFTDLVIKRTFLRKLPGFKRRLETYLMEDFDHSKTQEVDLLVGAAYIFPRKVYNEVGGFDKLYFLFMEDFDICREIRQKGYKAIYYPEVEMLHYHKRLSQGSFFKMLTKKIFWIHVSSAVKYFWKWRYNGKYVTPDRQHQSLKDHQAKDHTVTAKEKTHA